MTARAVALRNFQEIKMSLENQILEISGFTKVQDQPKMSLEMWIFEKIKIFEISKIFVVQNF